MPLLQSPASSLKPVCSSAFICVICGFAVAVDAATCDNTRRGKGKKMGDRGIVRLAAALIVLFACVLCGCGEGTEQAQPMAARSFNSKVPLEVWVMYGEGDMPRSIGKTPSAKPLAIPPCWMWGVDLPNGADMRAVGQEMVAQNIPGLRLYAKDEDLVHLRDAMGLRFLVLSYPNFTGAGLVHLKELKGLQWLDLAQTKVTDAGLAYLSELSALQTLNLQKTEVTDAGLAHFKELKGLRGLDLSGTQVTGAGFVHLKELKGLWWLKLGGTKVTDAGLVNLKELKGLQWLDLTGAEVTDAGLENFRDLRALTALNLGGTQVTDTGLVHIKELKGLQALGLIDTKVTDAGVEEFKQAMPKVQVLH